MSTVVLDRRFAEELQQQRAAAGLDRWDEVWEGTYMMAPLPDAEHQQIALRLAAIFEETVGWNDETMVLAGANISDRDNGWQQNYRCPDVVVYLSASQAKNRQTHWVGGPDFAVEIVSPDDKTRDKLPFYSKLGTRELLIIDRQPWSMQLLRSSAKKLRSVGTTSMARRLKVYSKVLPLSFRLVAGKRRPAIEVTRITDGKSWCV
jgi:Uma2 family endonuclease